MNPAVPVNDPEEMEKARNFSWMCNLFQENKLTVDQKQLIIRRLVNEYKKSRALDASLSAVRPSAVV